LFNACVQSVAVQCTNQRLEHHINNRPPKYVTYIREGNKPAAQPALLNYVKRI
jgi:hypothetical protein